MQSLGVPPGYKRIKWQKFTVISFASIWAEKMSLSSLRFNYVQFLWLLLEEALQRGERLFLFFPFFPPFIFCPLVCSFHQNALRHGAGAEVCSDLYLPILSDRISLKEIPSPKMGVARDPPQVFTAASCFLALSENRSQSRQRH